MASDVKQGEPFYFGVLDCRPDGTLDAFDVDGHPGISADEAALVDEMSDSIEDHGGGGTIYYCVPVARIDHVPRVKVKRIKQSERTGA